MLLFFRLLALVALVSLTACERQPEARLEGIILIVSDGTSQELITTSRVYSAGAGGKLAMDGLSNSAFVQTYSLSHVVTDSAAAATALARGIKAENRVLGMAKSGDQTGPESILDVAKKAGWSTGVISDDAVTGATPSAFLVELPRRTEYARVANKIASQLGPRADIVLGGGTKWFSDRDPNAVYPTGDHSIVQDTQKQLTEKGVRTFDSWEAFQTAVRQKPQDGPILGTFFPEEFPFYADGRRTLRLVDMVSETVKVFQQRGKPFLLIVEAGLPDKAAHLNNGKRAITEVLECDATVAWVRENLGSKVLLLVTTDHNTGGLVLNGYPPISYKGDALLQPDPVTDISILTWASGPGGQKTGNIRTSIVQEPGQPLQQKKDQKLATDVDYVQPALVPLDSALHTGGDVWLLADGAGAEKVRGTMDNTDIYRVMTEAIAESQKR